MHRVCHALHRLRCAAHDAAVVLSMMSTERRTLDGDVDSRSVGDRNRLARARRGWTPMSSVQRIARVSAGEDRVSASDDGPTCRADGTGQWIDALKSSNGDSARRTTTRGDGTTAPGLGTTASARRVVSPRGRVRAPRGRARARGGGRRAPGSRTAAPGSRSRTSTTGARLPMRGSTTQARG
jgi:hypothetical protein